MGSGVNVKFAKCLLVFMSLCTLIEGLLYTAASLWGIAIKHCAFGTPSLDYPFRFMEYFVYFQDKRCGEISFLLPSGEQAQLDMPDVTEVAFRTYIILIVYAAISGLWIVTSVTVLVALCSPITKTSYCASFLPWLLVVIAGSTLDVVATGFHIYDIINTLTSADTLNYLQVKNAEEVLPYLADYENYFVLPAVIYTCFSSRVVIIWILNVIGVSFAFAAAKDLMEQNKESPDTPSNDFSFEHTVTNPQVQRLPQPQPPPQQQEIRRRNEVRTLEPLKFAEPTATAPSPTQSQPPSILRQQSNPGNKRVNDLRTSSTSNHSEGLVEYPPQAQSPMISELSAESPLNMRYSQPEGFPFHSQAHVTEDMRSQMPWSYINFREDLQARKQVLSHTHPTGDLTIIPVPDYTLHPPKKERQQIAPPNANGTGVSRW